jgi:hypothetical protein
MKELGRARILNFDSFPLPILRLMIITTRKSKTCYLTSIVGLNAGRTGTSWCSRFAFISTKNNLRIVIRLFNRYR